MVPRISQLRSELEFLEEKFRLYQLALSPTRRLPAEILAEIFAFLDDRMLLKMSMVCRAWYPAFAALSSKALSTTRIRFNDGIPCNKARSWLEKPVKGVKPLELQHAVYRGSCGCYKSARQCPWVAPEFIAILTATPNLEGTNLGFIFSSPACLSSLVGSIGDTRTWRSIRNLDLTFPGTWPGRSIKYRIILNDLPGTLKTLTLKFWNLDKGRSIPPIEIPDTPFNMLTTLTVECGWDSPFVVSLLRASVNVEDLTLNLRHCKYTWTQTTDPIRLPQGDPQTSSSAFLVRLDIIFPSTNSYINDQPLKQVVDALRFLTLSQPAPRIRYLALERARDDADSLSAVLSVFPFLERLKLEIRCVYDNFDLASFLLYIKPRDLPSAYRVVTREAGKPPGEPDALRQVVLGYNSWANSANIQATWNENSSMLKALNDDFGVKVLKSRES